MFEQNIDIIIRGSIFISDRLTYSYIFIGSMLQHVTALNYIFIGFVMQHVTGEGTTLVKQAEDAASNKKVG